MMSKIFIDTNILIYSMDINDPVKMKKSRVSLNKINPDHIGVISTQVLQEFYVVATKKLKVEPKITKAILKSFENFEIINVTKDTIDQAIDISDLNKISFWDALILSAAHSANCSELWSEDLQNKQINQGIKIVNPFL